MDKKVTFEYPPSTFYKKTLLICALFKSSFGLSQADSTWQDPPRLTISGFMDVFYTYDFNKPQGSSRQTFLYNHNRHNEFNLNLGIIKLDVANDKYRANLAIQTGTYANDNYADEPGLLKNIFEANIGLSLNKKNNLWLDAGVLPSHIGFENAISTENPTLTRSLLAENSPYFFSGVKLSISPNDQWTLAGLVVNGWQRIQRLPGNSLLSFGTQILFSPSERMNFNWSTFIGTDDIDATKRMRFFNNFYSELILSDNFHLVAGLDIGVQQTSKGSSSYDQWYCPILIAQYHVNKQWKMAARAEYYHDPTGVIINTDIANGFRTTGLSINMDYSPTELLLCRIEGRLLRSKDPIFEKGLDLTDANFIIAASLAIKFSVTNH